VAYRWDLLACFEVVLADVAIQQMPLAMDQAIKRHEKSEYVPFELVVFRFGWKFLESPICYSRRAVLF